MDGSPGYIACIVPHFNSTPQALTNQDEPPICVSKGRPELVKTRTRPLLSF